eukprot:scaffold1411_cov396-Prasinococcus_capsulatus_cf.AAC.27
MHGKAHEPVIATSRHRGEHDTTAVLLQTRRACSSLGGGAGTGGVSATELPADEMEDCAGLPPLSSPGSGVWLMGCVELFCSSFAACTWLGLACTYCSAATWACSEEWSQSCSVRATKTPRNITSGNRHAKYC